MASVHENPVGKASLRFSYSNVDDITLALSQERNLFSSSFDSATLSVLIEALRNELAGIKRNNEWEKGESSRGHDRRE